MPRGPLQSRASAKVLIAAAIIDLFFVVLLTQALAPAVQREVRLEHPELVDIGSFLALLLVYWIVTELILGGVSIGRAVLDLHLRDASGAPMRGARKFRRGMAKIATGGLTGLNPNAPARYDRSCEACWYSSLAGPPPKPPAKWRLRVMTGAHKGLTVTLGDVARFRAKRRLNIGRDPGWADIVLPDDRTVSSRHCIIGLKDGVVLVKDHGRDGTGSASGVWIDGQRVTPGRAAPLTGARELRLGSVRIGIDG